MGMAHIGKISKQLIEAGRSEIEPVAIICKATMPNQQVLISNLQNCAGDVLTSDLIPPALIVVGEIVNFREQLNWLTSE